MKMDIKNRVGGEDSYCSAIMLSIQCILEALKSRLFSFDLFSWLKDRLCEMISFVEPDLLQ